MNNSIQNEMICDQCVMLILTENFFTPLNLSLTLDGVNQLVIIIILIICVDNNMLFLQLTFSDPDVHV